MNIASFLPAIGEIFLAASALLIVLLGAFSKPDTARSWSIAALVALIGSAVLVVSRYTGPATAFDRMFVQDNLSVAFKAIIAAGSLVAILLSVPFFGRRSESKFEYPLLVLLATIGMYGMVSAQDFLNLYVSLELQSLSLYILASFRRDQRHNSEAGLKYFFLGALSSGILLYGISLIYGYAGSTAYVTLGNTLGAQEILNPGIIIGLVLVLSGIAFKVAAAPFHMWAPDVYQGASTPVTALFAMAPKVAAIGVLCRLVTGPFAPVFEQTQQVLLALSIISMAVGSFAAIAQKNIKRLMAYSSIGHIGFILLALSAGGTTGVSAAIFYTVIYVVMSAGSFAFILFVYNNNEGEEDTGILAGFARAQPVAAASFAVLLLSMAGIPPMVGFLAKLSIFTVAVKSGLIIPAVLGVLFSVVSAYYYLRLIKIMYFDTAIENAPRFVSQKLWQGILILSAALNVILLVFPAPVSHLAEWAVRSLY